MHSSGFRHGRWEYLPRPAEHRSWIVVFTTKSSVGSGDTRFGNEFSPVATTGIQTAPTPSTLATHSVIVGESSPVRDTTEAVG